MDRPGIDFWVCLRFINNFVMQKYTGVFIVLLLAGLNAAAAKNPRKIDFVKEIQPIFEYNCVGCHREGFAKESGGAYQMDIKEHELHLRFNINNILDKKYLIGGGTTSVTAADGISFRLAAQLAF